VKLGTTQGNVVYDIDWPDGVYCLDLASPLHRAVVMELCDLEQLQRPQRGCSAIRLDGKLKGKGQCLTDLGYPGEAMPSRGTLECTYTSPLLPASPSPMDARQHELLRVALTADPDESTTLALLRTATRVFAGTTLMCFTTAQAVALLDSFEVSATERMHAAMALFPRVLDTHALPQVRPTAPTPLLVLVGPGDSQVLYYAR